MKGLLSLLMSLVLLAAFHSYAYASDWDVAGKILTGIIGVRLLSAGKVDIIGTMTGIGRDESREIVYKKYHNYGPGSHNGSRRTWVADYVWKKKWIPKHTEYDKKLGTVIIPGHYVMYKVQTGGRWEYIGRNKEHFRYHHHY